MFYYDKCYHHNQYFEIVTLFRRRKFFTITFSNYLPISYIKIGNFYNYSSLNYKMIAIEILSRSQFTFIYGFIFYSL